jgi:V8-like Glu-specific endopeptidase
MLRIRVLALILPAFAVAACGAQPRPASQLSQIIDDDDLEPVENAKGTPLYEYARAVGRVDLDAGGCTGFRVARDLFITNNHCWEGSTCAGTTITFGKERDLPPSEQVSLRCKAVLTHNPQLDYALYQITVDDHNARDTFPAVTLTHKAAAENQPLFVAGYPFGIAYKRMDRSANCKAVPSTTGIASWIAYTCDTDSGSSGSSVFDRATGRVVGLHWGHGEGNVNNGTAMGLILDDIEHEVPAAYAKLTIADD